MRSLYRAVLFLSRGAPDALLHRLFRLLEDAPALFGGFPADFHAAYRAAWPLHDGYRVRRELYNLYHMLNHANLFAGAYVRQAEQAIERLLAEAG